MRMLSDFWVKQVYLAQLLHHSVKDCPTEQSWHLVSIRSLISLGKRCYGRIIIYCTVQKEGVGGGLVVHDKAFCHALSHLCTAEFMRYVIAIQVFIANDGLLLT